MWVTVSDSDDMICGWQSVTVTVTWYVGDSQWQWQWHDMWVTVSDSDSDMICGWQSVTVTVTWYVGDSQWQWHDTWVTVSDSDMIRGWQSVTVTWYVGDSQWQWHDTWVTVSGRTMQKMNPKGLFTPKTRVFVWCGNSAADISKPHTFKWGMLARWHVGGRRFSVGELHTTSKTSSANGSHLNVWDFDISAAEKTRVFGGYRRKVCIKFTKTCYIDIKWHL